LFGGAEKKMKRQTRLGLRRAALSFGLASLCWASIASSGGLDVFRDGFESDAGTPQDDAEAARFLDQATFGPRLSDIAQLRSLGYEAWLDQQYLAPISLEIPYIQYSSAFGGIYQSQRIEAWFIHAAQLADPSAPAHTHSDQLRQRVAFALSQMFVVSDKNAALALQGWTLADYYDTLALHALGNYRDLLEAVTLHPAMGKYLSMLGNRKTDVALNIRPDENYAREILQLFSVGLVMLNPDGSVHDGDAMLAGVQPVPTYDQTVVRGFAHVFTGWNFDDCSVPEFADDCTPGNSYDVPWYSPMQPVEAYHDNTTDKQLLDYPGATPPNGVLVHGGDARQELEAALDNIFHHPNVGPFVARHLIQRLVTSNPTPGYVQRVAAAFDNNGQGVRGDLRATVRAVLLDNEARNGHLVSPQTFGRLRDPITKLVRLWRVAPGHSTNGRVFQYTHPEDEFAQRPLSAPSVFNFFKPNFAQPGEIRDAGLVSPEFQIHTDTQLVTAPNYLDWRIMFFWQGTNYSVAQADEETLMDYSALRALATSGAAALVDHLDLVMMSGGMSDRMRNLLLTRLAGTVPDGVPGMTGGTAAQRRAQWQVQQALYLIVNSPEFSVQK
jgi:uncharacterized protein (DUF1800 family)